MNRTDVAVVTPVLPGNLAINYDSTQDPDVIATNIANAIAAAGLTGFTPTTQALGVVSLGENTTSQVSSAGLSGIVRTGAPGDNVFAVTFSPSSTFDSARIAQALTVAINASPLNVTASVQAAAQRRVTLTGNQVTLQQNGVAVAQTVTPPLSFETPTNIVKGYRDMINVIGHTVNDPGPLGLADSLPGDIAGNPFSQPTRLGYNSNLQGQDNRFEGFYLDDFIIGFAERGEMVTGADRTTTNANSTAFVANPALSPTDIVVGPYQLEVRRSEEYSVASVPTAPFRSFDTNDRLATGLRLIAQDGARLIDGQTFTLSDGQNAVTFEYDDKSILPTNPRYGIEPGRIAVDFNPTEPDYVIAARIRDLINGPAVQAVLVGVSAALADGTDGVVRTGPSTDSKIDIFGQVSLLGVGSPVPESNDTIASATETGIVGLNSPNYRATGEIGDNPNFLLQRGKDVDLFHVYLNAGET
ncbi:MAG TPA: hypothetical protein PLV92_23470, partial [Pirellulaceae bacterium]|nr:hypothetical protein [Pirellulaceae bacterium]